MNSRFVTTRKECRDKIRINEKKCQCGEAYYVAEINYPCFTSYISLMTSEAELCIHSHVLAKYYWDRSMFVGKHGWKETEKRKLEELNATRKAGSKSKLITQPPSIKRCFLMSYQITNNCRMRAALKLIAKTVPAVVCHRLARVKLWQQPVQFNALW